jgi:hypothetical protein
MEKFKVKMFFKNLFFRWKNRKNPYYLFCKFLLSDKGLAVAYQANIVTPILDGANGKLSHQEANKIADDLMYHLWGVNMRNPPKNSENSFIEV